jgi:hypothetical protein
MLPITQLSPHPELLHIFLVARALLFPSLLVLLNVLYGVSPNNLIAAGASQPPRTRTHQWAYSPPADTASSLVQQIALHSAKEEPVQIHNREVNGSLRRQGTP